jgi:hypothetical protein
MTFYLMVKNYLSIFCNYLIQTYYFKKTKKTVSFSPNDNLNKYYNNFNIDDDNYIDDYDEYCYYINSNYAYYNNYYKNNDYNHKDYKKNDYNHKDYNHKNVDHKNDKNNQDYGYFIFIE